MCRVKIDNLDSDRIAITAPYNPEFVKKIKLAGGRWDNETRVWTMDTANVDFARKILRDVYGYDDITEVGTEFVRVRITALREIYAHCNPVILFGRVIASARGRDSGARAGEGVAFIEKQPQSGGSVVNWRTKIPEGAVFVVDDVPSACLDTLDKDDYQYEVIEKTRAEQLSRLKARRDELTAALTQIEAQIKALSDAGAEEAIAGR